ncbi:MAG: hypothetical protein Q8Q86_01740, partial [Candidatus Daviesbacteria bacterium]|nr:hypothetical protein [Candidatus Daviesbacteria bacterium]
MKKSGIILVLVMITLVGLWVWVAVSPNQTPQDQRQQKLFSKQSSDQGEVSVEVTPVVLEPG